VILPLFSALLRLYLEHCVRSGAHSTKHGPVRASPEQSHEDDHRAGAPLLRDQAGTVLFRLEKRRLQKDLRAAFQYLKGGLQERWEGTLC